MSLRAYARHRGVTLSAVQKAIDSRRITAIREEGGRITGVEKNQADTQWAARTDPAEAARSGTSTAPVSTSAPAAPAASSPAEPGDKSEGGEAKADDQANFLTARIREAELRGQLLELDKLERLGELLPRAIVRKTFSEIFAQLKIAAFRIPDRKAQALASETDPVRIHRVMSDELRQVFDEFSRQLDVPAAGVADDPAVAGERSTVLP